MKYVLPPIRSEQSLNIVPKLIRIAVIGLVLLIGYKGVQALIVRPPIDQQKIEKTVEEQGKENERRHQEEMAEIKAMRLGFAREYNKIGDVQQAQGDLEPRSNPTPTASPSGAPGGSPTPAMRAGSAISRCRYEKIGDVQLAQGNLEGR